MWSVIQRRHTKDSTRSPDSRPLFPVNSEVSLELCDSSPGSVANLHCATGKAGKTLSVGGGEKGEVADSWSDGQEENNGHRRSLQAPTSVSDWKMKAGQQLFYYGVQRGVVLVPCASRAEAIMATALIDEHVRTYQTAVWWMNGGGGGKAGPQWPLRE